MMPGRFFLGVGAGERLNEHILGTHWPAADVRLAMLDEAIQVIRGLWQGDTYSHHGEHFTVEDARIYTLPGQPPPLLVAASGPAAARLAGRSADGLIAVTPSRELADDFRQAGGNGKPAYGQVKVCWAADEAQARRTVREIWPNGGLPGPLNAELRQPSEFEAASQLVSEARLAETIVCGPDPERYLAAVRPFAEAGFDHLSFHQVGPDQAGFFDFFERELRPILAG
jgi:G6PDH family F420-dependent oxidoreductase